jgi:hypothetical protein
LHEILLYHPKLKMRDREGKTAVFAAGEYRYRVEDGARVECVRLLAKAGADVNAHDNEGNTPLHETFLTDVEEELLKLGADVNARNKDGETPIFTTVDDDAIPLFIEMARTSPFVTTRARRRWRPLRKKGLFGKKLSARQFKVRTSVSSRLRGIEDPSHGGRASSCVKVAIRATRYLLP